jgi:hypothetical protein
LGVDFDEMSSEAKSRLLRLTAGILVSSFVGATVWGATKSDTGHQSAAYHPPRVVVLHSHSGFTTESFALTTDTGIQLGGNPNAFLTDLHAGETAHIAYTVENGFWVAHQIVVNPPAGTHVATQATGTEPNYLHTRGTILSYNAYTGVLVIRHNR